MSSQLILILILVVAFILGSLVVKVTIPLLHRFKFGQNIRTEGPKSHFAKSGTPTMGGIIIILYSLLVFFILLLIFQKKIENIHWVDILIMIFPYLGYGIIGLIDDALIVIKKNNNGLKPQNKFLLELLVAALFYFLYLSLGYENTINFFGAKVNLGFVYGILILFLFSGMSNATNFTDGLDGLLSLTSITTFLCIGIFAYLKEQVLIGLMCLAIIISLVSFLVFNLPKATIFMGDTGSLAIGGLMSSMMIILKAEVLLLFIGIIYISEVVSVMLQVWYFKRTKGKRILRMAPLHHHFELGGFSEAEIDILFSFINLLFSIIGIYLGVKLF